MMNTPLSFEKLEPDYYFKKKGVGANHPIKYKQDADV